MWENMKQAIADIFSTHGKRKTGLLVGVAIGVAILLFGLWKTLFVLICGGAGLYIGERMDKGEDLVGNFLSKISRLEKHLPEKFQR